MSENNQEGYEHTAEFYDYVAPYQERQDVAFFVEEARRTGGPVLEIGCGTGRVLIPTAREGIGITGLDLSQGMLEICRQRLLVEPEDVRQRTRLVEADMLSFDLGQTFRLATFPFRPFQHLLTVEDQVVCLETVRHHLEPGGRLVLDLFNPSLYFLAEDDIGQEKGEESEFSMPDGRRVVRWHKIVTRDLSTQVQHVELIYYVMHPDGRKERLVDAFPMRYLFRYEAEHLLERCGFEVESVYGGYDRQPFGTIYPGELILLAVKK
jgi:SAM-dependent methyltransferase